MLDSNIIEKLANLPAKRTSVEAFISHYPRLAGEVRSSLVKASCSLFFGTAIHEIMPHCCPFEKNGKLVLAAKVREPIFIGSRSFLYLLRKKIGIRFLFTDDLAGVNIDLLRTCTRFRQSINFLDVAGAGICTHKLKSEEQASCTLHSVEAAIVDWAMNQIISPERFLFFEKAVARFMSELSLGEKESLATAIEHLEILSYRDIFAKLASVKLPLTAALVPGLNGHGSSQIISDMYRMVYPRTRVLNMGSLARLASRGELPEQLVYLDDGNYTGIQIINEIIPTLKQLNRANNEAGGGNSIWRIITVLATDYGLNAVRKEMESWMYVEALSKVATLPNAVPEWDGSPFCTAVLLPYKVPNNNAKSLNQLFKSIGLAASRSDSPWSWAP